MENNSGRSARVKTVIIFRSISPAESSDEMRRLRRSTRSLALKNFPRSLRWERKDNVVSPRSSSRIDAESARNTFERSRTSSSQSLDGSGSGSLLYKSRCWLGEPSICILIRKFGWSSTLISLTPSKDKLSMAFENSPSISCQNTIEWLANKPLRLSEILVLLIEYL